DRAAAVTRSASGSGISRSAARTGAAVRTGPVEDRVRIASARCSDSDAEQQRELRQAQPDPDETTHRKKPPSLPSAGQSRPVARALRSYGSHSVGNENIESSIRSHASRAVQKPLAAWLSLKTNT